MIITVDVRPDRIDEFVAGITTNAIASLRDEPGCLAFDVHRDQASGPGSYFYEIYTDEDAFAVAHGSAPHYAVWQAIAATYGTGLHRRSGVSAAGPPGGGQDQLGRAVAQVGPGTGSAAARPKRGTHPRPRRPRSSCRPEARRLIREAGRDIGEVLAGAVNLLNPDALVIAGDMAKAYDIFVAGLRETVYGNATAVATRELQILPSTHGDQSGVIGSAAMILDHVQVCRSYGRCDLTDSYRI